MREIVCEENYMEVSVIRIVPLDRKWLKTDPQQTWPLVYGRLSQRWQVQFIVNNTLLTMSAADAFQRGYGVNATATRVVFRAPYRTLEAMSIKADGYQYDVILSIMYYSQALIRLIVNTTLACPTDPPIFTPTTLSWLSPAFLTPLVLDPSLYTPMSLNLGLNGQLISSNVITQNGYTFRHDRQTIEVTVPIGAPGGYIESDILNNTYGSTYRIHLLTDQEWSEQPADITRHTVWKRIETPFLPLPPIFINYTIPESGYFNVSLGNFFPDVDLKSFIINKVPLTLTEAKNRGLVVHKVPNSNGTNAYLLQVPFSNPLVVQEYLSGATRLYTLYVTYLMTLTPKDKDFTYAEVVECSLQDVVIPKYTGSCGTDRLVLEMTHGNLDRYWVPYIRDLPLTRDLAQSQNYVTYQQGSVFHMEVPLFAVGLVYEDITLRGIVARLDWTLRDNKTLAILSRHSHTCRFPADRLLVCFPNGTVKATVLSLDTRPNFNPRKTHLKDQTCTPDEADDTRALFFFSVFSCGTTSQDEEKQRLDEFLCDLALLGSLQGFRYFQPWLRGREEILITVINEDLICPSLRSPTSLSSDSSCRISMSSSDPAEIRGSAPLPPASPCDREIAIPETHCTLFLLATYAKYGRPYVWVRSNHQRLVGQDDFDLKDTPLMLQSTNEWDTKDVGVWHVVWDVVNACVSPPPRNALAVDFSYLRSLSLSERSLSSGALIGFFHSLLLREPRGTPIYTYVWEELGELTRLHAQTLRDLKDSKIMKDALMNPLQDLTSWTHN